MLDKFQNLFNNCREKGTLPQNLRDAVSLSLYINKGEKSDCPNNKPKRHSALYCRHNLGSRLLNRLTATIAQENTPESQCGFRANGGTVDMIFVLR